MCACRTLTLGFILSQPGYHYLLTKINRLAMALLGYSCRFFLWAAKSPVRPPAGKKSRRAFSPPLSMHTRLTLEPYGFFAAFFGVRFTAFFSLSRPPIRLNASVELNGN